MNGHETQPASTAEEVPGVTSRDPVPPTTSQAAAGKPEPAGIDVVDYAQLFAAVLAVILLLVAAASLRELLSTLAAVLATVTTCNLVIYLHRHRRQLTAVPVIVQGAVMTLVIVGSIVTAAVLRPQTTDSARSPGPSPQAVAPTADVSTPATRRTLLNWVSDVNRTCAPIIPKLKAEKARYGASQSDEAGIASLENAQNLIKPIIRDITTAIELPSEGDDQARAKDWIDSYRELYARFVDVNQKLQDFADATGLERILTASKVVSAKQGVLDAATATKTKGDALGIVCPWVSTTG